MRTRWTAISVLMSAAVALATLTGPTGPADAADPCPKGTPPPRGGAYSATTQNPLDDFAWAAGHGRGEELWKAYCSATGTTKSLLGKIALQPRMLWFGHWFSPGDIQSRIREYVVAAQNGNPNVLVHLSVFRLWPREEAKRGVRLTTSEKAAYRTWVDNAARGIGSAHVAMVLEPDLGIVFTPRSAGSLFVNSTNRDERLALARYAARKFGALPNTHVYIDGSSADWLSPKRATWMLRHAGVRYVRGFALGATHYSTLGNEIMYAHRVSVLLAKAGLPGKKAIIDTSDNPRGFTYQHYYREHPGGFFDNAEICRSRADRTCVTLGVPPTWRVGNAAWGLTATQRAEARTHVDGYTWFGRSWQYAQSSPFRLNRALGMAKTSPY